ncbi:MAG: protein NO VEIN domain-containing protein, partial [Candidatus Njordarchaeales archaeon]
VGLQRPSDPYMELIRKDALCLLNKIFDGFDNHPYFFIFNTRADPPVLPFAHQTELLFRLAFRKPIRILVGDEIGLGKTIEAIFAAKLLEKRDNAKRILLLVPRILVEQWKSELKRFGIHPKVIKRRNIALLSKQDFPEGWYIASIDLVKRNEHKPNIVSADWDVIIVDEAHRVGKTRAGQTSYTQRYELVKELVRDTKRNVIFLSATPHRGHAKDYISRLKLIDPYLIGEKELDNEVFYRLTRDSIVIRRTKMDVNEVYEHRRVFKKARFIARVINASSDEVKFNKLLFDFLRDKLLKYYEFRGEEPKALPLLLALVAKRASSSPYAAMLTLERMLKRRSLVIEGKASTLIDASRLDAQAKSFVEAYLSDGFEDYGEIDWQEEAIEPDEYLNKFVEECSSLLDDRDFEVMKKLFELSKSIMEKGDSRLKGVMNLIKEHASKGDKVVVFTEYKDTAKYLYKKISEEMPDVAESAALITSEGILIPDWRERRGPTIEDLKRHLRTGHIKLIVSTDVASEGLNLQVANIIINYEPTWSPLKVEQRLGRVWRLGQEKDVTSYTLFLAIRSDRDVLDVLYKKLLAWGRSLQESRVSIGEEIIIDMMTEEGYTTIPIDISKGTPKYSEYKAIITYIREGRLGLENYVQSIINALVSLKKSLERVGLARRNVAFKIERLLTEVLGDFRGEDVDKIFKELFKTVAKLRGIEFRVDGDRIFAETYKLDNVYDVYSSVKSILSTSDSLKGTIFLITSAQIDELKELHLFQVTTFFKDKQVYSETVGVGVKDDESVELIRGKELLNLVSKALMPEYLLSSVQEYTIFDESLQNYRLRASKEVLNKVVRNAVEEFKNYISALENRHLSSQHHDWLPRDLSVYDSKAKYIGTIIFSSSGEVSEGQAPPPNVVKEIEEVAMNFAIEYERKSGRIPEDVSEEEHFDILSRNPETGKIRFIEVKGKSGLNLEVELTEAEFKEAKKKGKQYWLYIVYGIRMGKPRLLAIQDPVNNMRWEEIGVKRYRFRPEQV